MSAADPPIRPEVFGNTKPSAATIPWEAFDDTHPDHGEWVERAGRLFCADDCSLHPMERPDSAATRCAAPAPYSVKAQHRNGPQNGAQTGMR